MTAFLAVFFCLCYPASARAQSAAALLGQANQAFVAHDYPAVLRIANKISAGSLRNPDYLRYLVGQSLFLSGDYQRALSEFSALAKDRRSRFSELATWRIADSLWELGRKTDSQSKYRELLGRSATKQRSYGDRALAKYRIGLAAADAGKQADATAGLRRVVLEHPLHPLADDADRELRQRYGKAAGELSAGERIDRAVRMTSAKNWEEAMGELAQVADSESEATRRRRDFWTGMTLFKMRRQYKRAGDLLLGLYKDMGDDAATALFHGARALSRADFDKEAIGWYQRVVSEYPRSKWAAEAQFLSGWLEFNMGNYRAGLPYLSQMQKLYPRSRYARDARWYLAFSHYLLGDLATALPLFEKLAGDGGREKGGQGQYWHARTLEQLGRKGEAAATYKRVITRFPFTWYALLATARLKKAGVTVSPFGNGQAAGSISELSASPSKRVQSDPLVLAVDELIDAGMGPEASYELRRVERTLLKKHPRPDARAVLLDRYRKAGDFNRPWMLAVVHGGTRALNREPEGRARVWWEHAYPLAYRELVEKWQSLGKSPPYYLYTIMRKESGFNPRTHSYADARGLLQMIPPTTQRVVRELGLEYTDDMLFDPELNIRTGSWYIGSVLAKFRGQIPLGSGSFNSGPRAVMRWADKNGDRPMDEFVELVSYTQTRNYMRRVTETYARYLYLYTGTLYEQPLVVDKNYVKNQLTY